MINLQVSAPGLGRRILPGSFYCFRVTLFFRKVGNNGHKERFI
jgi:hypothetical protein